MLKPFRCLLSLVILPSALVSGAAQAQGTLEEIRVPGPALEGNLAGEETERITFVYLPPGYESSDRHYPVIYFLHGYSVGAERYVNDVLGLPAAADEAMAEGAGEVILVMPDAFTRYGGSMYSSSPTIGDWETFIARDLVSHIEANYRTLSARESRGLSGHSMGGYGALRIGMRYPQVFEALYAMSACCLLNQAPEQSAVQAQLERMDGGLEEQSGSFANVVQAQAAAWAPNPDNDPYYFDLPYRDGEFLPLVAGKWTANSPLVTVDQHVPSLKSFAGIMLDVGDEDTLEATNTQLSEAMTRLGVEHGYEVYEGDHGNRVGQRFVDELLPFFATHLNSE